MRPVALLSPRVSVLGVGAMGRLHARVLAELAGELTLAGVYDPDAARAREVAPRWAVPAFADEAEAIAAADLVVVASPIEAHAGTARRALARGRHVLVEKPLCASAAEAFALVRAVGRGQRLFVGHSERLNPVVRALRALVRPAAIRAIRLLRVSTTVRSGREHSALVSLGVHDVDLFAYLTDSEVALRETRFCDDDRAELVLSSASGADAWVHVDRRAATRERRIEVRADDAVFAGDLLAQTLTVTRQGVTRACPVAIEEPLVAQAKAIAAALRGEAGPVATGLDGARAIALVEQATKPAERPLATGTS